MQSPSPVNVVVCDEQALVRDAVTLWLSQSESVSLLGAAKNLAELERLATDSHPEVILTEIFFAVGSIAQTLERVRCNAASVQVLLFTEVQNAGPLRRAIEALDASCILKRHATPKRIEEAILRVADGERFIGPAVSRLVILETTKSTNVNLDNTARFASLSERERAILSMLGRGFDTARIAGELGLASKTVRNYISSILTKLQVSDRTAAALIAAGDPLLGKRNFTP